jgi:hypothetical protein
MDDKLDYVIPKGKYVQKEYKKKKNIKSVNQQLSEDLDATIKDWNEQGCKEYSVEEFRRAKDLNGLMVRYITKDDMARIGGILMKKDSEEPYFVLRNKVSGLSWSVQYKNMKKIFVL